MPDDLIVEAAGQAFAIVPVDELIIKQGAGFGLIHHHRKVKVLAIGMRDVLQHIVRIVVGQKLLKLCRIEATEAELFEFRRLFVSNQFYIYHACVFCCANISRKNTK